MISKEIFKKVRKLEIRTKGLVHTIFRGEYSSAFKGRGMTFSEVRTYHYGDDIRQIDWNVTARNGEHHIKIFEEEREQTLMLLVDVSPSNYFGSEGQRKIDLATELAAVLAFSAIKNNDKVGMILFTDVVELVILPRKGRTHVLRLIRELYSFKATGKRTNVNVALDYANRILNRRSIMILISDMQSQDFDKQMRITHKKHDLVNVLVEDRFENELPNLGIIPYYDAETNKYEMVDTSSATVRQAFSKRRIERKGKLLSQFTKLGIDTIELQTNRSYIEPLMKFFERRSNRY
ncbi:MAG: DUF58 domain-containing protein [Balneolales bacterium]|nr:DUF58 domain-containing protein [Balneolales bacterium]